MYNSTLNGTESLHPNISTETLNEKLLTSLLPVTFFIGLEAVFGLIGNILILCVYTRLYLHCNFRYFVISLAVYDLTGCVTTLPGEIFSELNWYDYKYDWHCKLKSYFNVFTVWGSAFTLLILAFDRYRKICRPLGWQIRPSLARRLCVGGLILSSIVAIPALILWGTQTYTYNLDNVSVNVSICEKSGKYLNVVYPFIYVTCVYILPIGLMMMAICVWNVLIGRQLFCKLQELRSTNKTASEAERKFVQTVSSRNKVVTERIRNAFCLTRIFGIAGAEAPTRSTKRNSITSFSVSSADLQEVERLYITKDVRDNQDLHCTETFSRQDSNNSNSGGTSSPVDRLVLRDIRPEVTKTRRKRKTLIMLILTSVFIVTVTIYIVLISLVADRKGVLRNMSNQEKAAFFFFLRIYFMNCVINPILYGIMDPRFRRGLKRLLQRICRC